MHRRTLAALAALLASLAGMACGGETTAPAPTPVDTTLPPTTEPSTTVAPTTAPTTSTTPGPTTGTPDPVPRDELGTCEIMGASEGGWEVVLRIPAVLGGGTYRVEYALRDGDSTILDRVHAEIALGADDTVQYWDSPRSTATGVVSCDVLRLLQGNEACVDVDDCVLSV